MIRSVALAAAIAFSLESAALACSCMAPKAPSASRESARALIGGAVAIVEADLITQHVPGGKGETARVHRTLFGAAPATFRIKRGKFDAGPSCALLLNKGARHVFVLRPVPGQKNDFTVQGACSDYLVNEPRYLAITLEEAKRR